MGNPYEARPNVFDAKPIDTSSDEREAAPTKTSTDLPENPTQYAVPSGSVKEVLEWVGDDKDKARAALETEQGDDKPRATLVRELNEILSA